MTSAKIQPSCARTERGCPSLVIPGSASATPKTAAPSAAAERERDDALDALAVEHDPRRRGEAGERDAEARVRQQQRHREPVQEHDACEPGAARKPERERHARRRRGARARSSSRAARAAARAGRSPNRARARTSRAAPTRRARRAAPRRRVATRARGRARADEHAEQRERRVDERPVRRTATCGRATIDQSSRGRTRARARRASRGRASGRPRRGAALCTRSDGGAASSAKPADPDERGIREPAAEEEGAQTQTAPATRRRREPPGRSPAARTAGDASIVRTAPERPFTNGLHRDYRENTGVRRDCDLRAGVQAAPWADLHHR